MHRQDTRVDEILDRPGARRGVARRALHRQHIGVDAGLDAALDAVVIASRPHGRSTPGATLARPAAELGQDSRDVPIAVALRHLPNDFEVLIGGAVHPPQLHHKRAEDKAKSTIAELDHDWQLRLRINFRAKGKPFPPDHASFRGVICRDPLILYHLGCDTRAFAALHEALGNREAWIIRGADWAEQSPLRAARWAAHVRLMGRQWPRHRYILACNARSAVDLLQAAIARAHFVHHNALLDERRFTIEDGAEKEFDAVYTARLVPFKRIELAAKVKRLAILTYSVDEFPSLQVSLRTLIGCLLYTSDAADE